MGVATLGMLLCIFVHISMSPAQESPGNVALHKPASQSSTFNGTDTFQKPPLTYTASADLAVDGAPTKSYLDKTCAVTEWLNDPRCTDNPWWQVDLRGMYDVFNVTIYQRGEGGTGTYNYGPLVVHIGDHVERPENRTKYSDRHLVSIPLSPPVMASTVNISILGCGILILCEVEVFAVRHVDKCASNPCQHGGTCADGLLNYACTCASGYTGVSCETDVDECGSSPCQRGVKCENLVGRFKCNCPPGYNGTRCETDINECARSPCQHGDCSDGVNSYSCTCLPGYTGLNCSQVRNNCKDGINSYKCLCTAGYTGAICDQPTTSAPVPAPSATSRASVECGGVVCDNGGMCKMTPGGSTCVCSAGYTGLSCHSKCQTGQYGLERSQTCPSCEDGYGCHYVHGACPPKAPPERYAEGVGTGLGVGLGTSLLLALGIFALLRCRRRGNPSSEKASTNNFPMSPRQAMAVSRQQGTASRGQEADPYESLDDATKDLGQSSPYSELEGARRGQEGASPYSYSSESA